MKWYVSTKGDEQIVEAKDQWEAFDSLRDRPLPDLGLIVTAQPVNETEEEEIGVRTSMLLVRWGRAEEARNVIAAVVAGGGPDTSGADFGEMQ